MATAYTAEELTKLITSHLIAVGYKCEGDKVLSADILWRPPLYAKRKKNEFAIDIRTTNTITDFWITRYKQTYQFCPNLKVFVAIPEDIDVPYVLGKQLEKNNVGIIVVSYDEIYFLLKPQSTINRKKARAIRRVSDSKIDKASYEGLEPYVTEITGAVSIFEIGYPREAIGAVGRILETAIDNFLSAGNSKHKIKLSEAKRKSMTFDSKIRYLASEKGAGGKKKPPLVTPGEEAKMLAVKWDRNTGDHPADTSEIERLVSDARATLELGINMIGVVKKKTAEL